MERKYLYPIAGISIAIVALAMIAISESGEKSMILRSEAQIQNKVNETTDLFVTGTATRMINPDKASITLTLEVEKNTAAEAVNANAQIMNKVVERLNEIGIKEQDISTNYYSVFPVYASKRSDMVCIQIYPPPPECLEQVIVGYKVVNSINVITSANANIGSIIDNAIEAGMNRVDNVYFFVSQELQDKVSNELLKEAVNNAKNKAEIIAESLNLQVLGIRNISINYNVPLPPLPVIQPAVRESTTPIFPSQQQISASVNITFIIG